MHKNFEKNTLYVIFSWCYTNSGSNLKTQTERLNMVFFGIKDRGFERSIKHEGCKVHWTR